MQKMKLKLLFLIAVNHFGQSDANMSFMAITFHINVLKDDNSKQRISLIDVVEIDCDVN